MFGRDDLNRKLNLLLREPDCAKRYFDVGVILCHVGDWENAERYLGRAYALDSADGEVLHHYAVAAYHRQNYRKATELCRAGLGLNAADSALREMLGDCCYLLGEYEQAAEICEKWRKPPHGEARE